MISLGLSIHMFFYRRVLLLFYCVLLNAATIHPIASISPIGHFLKTTCRVKPVNSRMERMPPELAEQVIFTNKAVLEVCYKIGFLQQTSSTTNPVKTKNNKLGGFFSCTCRQGLVGVTQAFLTKHFRYLKLKWRYETPI